jgi:hypothetical protein
MAVGAPILSISENNSEMAHIIREQNIGASFPSNSQLEILNFIYKICEDKELLEHYRKNSLAASKLFTSKNSKLFVQPNIIC